MEVSDLLAGKTPREDPTAEYELGILFVHGIGEQKEGDTLRAFGEPVFRWVKDRLADGAEVTLSQARLHPQAESGSATTAHAVLTIRRDNRESRWLLAESWWAERFPPPSFLQVLAWTFGIIPWITLTQAIDSLTSDDRPRGGSRLARVGSDLIKGTASTLMVALVLPLALLVQAVGLVLAILTLIPGLDRIAGWIQRFIGKGVGDSYALLTSPMALASMVTKIRDDMEWVADPSRSAQVVVVAHSQGSALARRALKDHHPPNVSRFITVGQAIGKLEALDILSRSRGAMWAAVGASILTTAGTVLFAVSFPGFHEVSFGPIRWGAAAIAVAAWIAVLRTIAIALGFGVRRLTNRRASAIAVGNGIAAFEWHDLWASADPVPNGPLFEDSDENSVRSYGVRNLSSFIRDHTAYVRNRDEFMPRLVATLPITGPEARLLQMTSSALDDGAGHRHRRVTSLVVARLLILVLLGFIVWRSRGAWTTVGNRDELCWEDFRTVVDALPTILQAPLSFALFKGSSDCLRLPWLTLVPVLAVPIVLWLWLGWNERSTRRFLTGEIRWTIGDWLWSLCVVAVPIAAASIALPLAHSWYRRGTAVPLLNVVAAASGFSVFALLAFRSPSRIYSALWESAAGPGKGNGWSRDFFMIMGSVAILFFFNLPLAATVEWIGFLSLEFLIVGVKEQETGKNQTGMAWVTSLGFLFFFGFTVSVFLTGVGRLVGLVAFGLFAAAFIAVLSMLQVLRGRDPQYWLPMWSPSAPDEP